MENQMVRRRANVIAAHLASHEDISATATHVFPMRCSNSLNSVVRRCDNRTYFARQGSSSQGFFMRQASSEQGYYMPHSMPFKSPSCGNKGSVALEEAPMFAKPVQVQPNISSVKEKQSVVQGYRYTDPASDAPIFARPSKKCVNPQFRSNERTKDFASNGFQWSPRMDVTESRFNYVVTLEIPGVSIDSIKVEVNNQSLIVTGKRSTSSCAAGSSSNKSASSYHRREILQGPYQVVWPLPTNANKETVSAEIQEGLLRITVPKLSGLRWLRKAHM